MTDETLLEKLDKAKQTHKEIVQSHCNWSCRIAPPYNFPKPDLEEKFVSLKKVQELLNEFIKNLEEENKQAKEFLKSLYGRDTYLTSEKIKSEIVTRIKIINLIKKREINVYTNDMKGKDAHGRKM